MFLLSFLRRAHSDIYMSGLNLALLFRATYSECDSTISLMSLQSDDIHPGVRSLRITATALNPCDPVMITSNEMATISHCTGLSEVNVGTITSKCMSSCGWCKCRVRSRKLGNVGREPGGTAVKEQNSPCVRNQGRLHGRTWLAFCLPKIMCHDVFIQYMCAGMKVCLL